VKSIGYLFLTLAVVSVAFLTGFTWRDLWAHRPPSVTALKGLVDPKAAAKKSPTEIFQDQFDHILASSAYDISPDKLKYSAMSGMFSALGDPHTNFLEPDDADSLKLETRGDFVGIGRAGHDLRAALRERQRDRPADAARAAGN